MMYQDCKKQLCCINASSLQAIGTYSQQSVWSPTAWKGFDNFLVVHAAVDRKAHQQPCQCYPLEQELTSCKADSASKEEFKLRAAIQVGPAPVAVVD